MPSPLISVYMPTYESTPSHLRAAIDSVVAQTHGNWELFIHDDCSKAGVRAMVEPYLRDPRIRFARSPVRLGIGGNWNACLKFGTGAYVQYMFQDDVWYPAYLERAVKPLEQDAGLGFVSVDHEYRIEGEKGEREEGYAFITACKRENLRPGKQDSQAFLRWWIPMGLRPNVIGEPMFVMLRRSLMQEIGPFREDMPQGIDAEYWIRAMLHADWFYIRDELGFFRVHAEAASTRNDREGKGLFDRLRLFDVLLQRLPRGELRRLTASTLRRELGAMAGKFTQRRQAGKKVGGSGSKALLHLALRHPVLTMGGFLEYVLRKSAEK